MWNTISVGFNAEEETVNFGTRACAANDDALYETNTLAAIHAGEEKPTHNPAVHTRFFKQVGLCVAVNSSLIMFSEDCTNVKCILTFQSIIDAFTVSPCGSFVLVSVCGELKCCHISIEGKEIFSRSIYPDSGLQNIIMLECYKEDEEISIILVLSNGRILKFTGFNFSTVEEITMNRKYEEITFVEELQSQVVMGLSLLKEKDSILLGSTRILCMLHLKNFDRALFELLEGYKILKIGGIINSSTLFGLCDNGYILLVCLHTMTPYFLWTEIKVKDFIILEGNTAYECNLLMLCADPLKSQQTVAFVSWPGFKVKYRLPIGDYSFLIHQKGSEEILFLEGFGNDVIDTIRVKAVVESCPELRLERMLRRYKFEEAERFARTFTLDLQIVYKAHVQKLCQELSPWNMLIDTQKKIFNKIMDLIERIKDDHFVAEICVTAIPPDFAMLHTMFMYGMDRFSKVTDKSGTNLSGLLEKVSTIARRLDTCMLIHGSSTTIDHWINFPKHDLLISCINHIKRGEIKEGILIWSRHLCDMSPLLTIDKAKLLLNAIPKSTKLQELLTWLPQFIPSILECFPNIFIDVVQWTVQRARDLEMLDTQTWPNSGLVLANTLLQFLRTPYVEKSVLLQSQRIALRNENLSHQSPLNQLLQLIDNLQDINTLKESYGVHIQYDEFIQDDPSSFVAVLLERLPLEKICLFMLEFYHRLTMERHLNPDLQILQFIQDIVTNCEDWWFWDEAPWESRVSALISYINNIEVKLDAIQHVLTSAPVPWTTTISRLVELGVHLPHHKANDIRNECNNVPKRLIMKKYGILMEGNCEIQLIHLILKKNQKNVIDDINKLTKHIKGDITDIYLVVMIHWIENGQEETFLKLLKTIDQECKSECISRLMFYIHRLLTCNEWKKVPIYFECMQKLDNVKESSFFFKLKNIYTLKMEFEIETTFGKMYIDVEKRHILKKFADETGNELMSETSKPSFAALEELCMLSHLLNMTAEEGITQLSISCVQHNLQLALMLSSAIEDLEKKPDQVYNIVSALISQLTASFNPVLSHESIIEMFITIIPKLAKHFLTFSTDCHLNNIIKLVSLLNQSCSSVKPVLKTVYADPSPTAATSLLIQSSLQNIFYCYIQACKSTGAHVDSSVRDVMLYIPEILVENREMMLTWQRLKEEQQDLLCIRQVFEYCWSQKIMNPAFQETVQIQKFLIQCIEDLLRKLFRLHNFDIELAVSLLHFLSRDEALNFLITEAQSVGHSYQRLSGISKLALTYSSINKIDKHTKVFRKNHISCKWAKKLNELGITYKDAFKDSDTEQRQLILKLVALPSTTVSLLKEFCIDKVFDQQECLMMFIQYLLLHWEPLIHIKEDPSSGDKLMVVKNSKSELLEKCRTILNQLGTKGIKTDTGTMSWAESIQKELMDVWPKVNPYYYEVYLVLADIYQVIFQQTAHKEMKRSKVMLKFLLTYTRISSPTESEQEKWFQLFPNTNHLPPISNFRLPFTLLIFDSWSVIKPELSLKTYKMWYDIIPNLNLDRDTLCTLAIQRLSRDQLAGGTRDKNTWHLQACNNSVLQEIQECVKKIVSQEMASAALYYVVNHMPPGADQVEAVTLCYMQAEQWISKDNSEKAITGFAKVQKKYLTVHTFHLLHAFGLGKEKYLQLVLHPQELICALYNDPSILDRKTGAVSHCPDINGLVYAISHLHHMNLMGIQQELLSEWLYPPDSPPLDISCDDFTQNFAAVQSIPLTPIDNDSIIRACYMLESMEVEIAARYLICHAGISNETECRPTSVRLRALQCLCSIASADIVLNTTGRSLDNIKTSMRNLMFVCELEKLGLVWSVKSFETCDKEDVVGILLKKGSPHSVQLAAAMGCVFKLTNIQNWDQILQLMTSYKMVDELSVVLPELTRLSYLLNGSIFTKAWNCALITPLQKAEYPLNVENSLRVKRSVEMLYTCPIPRQVDLFLMLNHCQRLNSEELITRLQPFLSFTQSTKQIMQVKIEPSN